jgi:cytochrome c oxidase subunit III
MSCSGDALREPWQALGEQREAAQFGIWIFLASEVLFFGAFFMGFAYLRILHPAAFALASRHTAILFGTINTALLLTSGLTMGLGVRAAGFGLKRVATALFSATAAIGLAFLVVKGLEYHGDIVKGLIPGAHFALGSGPTQLFFGAYWIVTAVHLVHLSIGVAVVARLAIELARARLPLSSPQIEVTGLYWAFVDIVWVLLYPLIYLGGRS